MLPRLCLIDPKLHSQLKVPYREAGGKFQDATSTGCCFTAKNVPKI